MGKKKKETTQEEHPKEKINFIFQEIEEKTEKTIIENYKHTFVHAN